MSDTSFRDLVYLAIDEERDKQDDKWGEGRKMPNEVWATILAEEVGEAAQASLKDEEMPLRREIIQIAAVAIAWIEALEEHGSIHWQEQRDHYG
jgi:hypothetical protein